MPSPLPSPARLALATLTLTLLSTAHVSLQPITPPTGPFNVGVSKHIIPFVNPDDPFAPGNVTTAYLATVFYPTLDRPPGPATPYLHPETARIYGTHYGLPLDKLRALTAPTLRWGATPAPAAAVAELTGRNYSTLVWGPGGLGPATEAYTALLSDLASRGYAVVGIDHPYEQPFVWYPNPAAPGGGGGPADPGPGLVGTPTDIEPTDAMMRQLYAVRLREMLHVTEAGWPALVADNGWPFATAGVGVAGHSFGGALALDVAGRTAAGLTAAAMNLDGSIYEATRDAHKPQWLFGSYLHVAGDDPDKADVSWSQYSRAQTDWWRRTLVNDFGHSDCSDVALWKELGPNKISNFSVGDIPGNRAVEITRGMVGAFFDRFVRGIADSTGVLDNPGKIYKEVDLLGGSDGNSSATV